MNLAPDSNGFMFGALLWTRSCANPDFMSVLGNANGFCNYIGIVLAITRTWRTRRGNNESKDRNGGIQRKFNTRGLSEIGVVYLLR